MLNMDLYCAYKVHESNQRVVELDVSGHSESSYAPHSQAKLAGHVAITRPDRSSVSLIPSSPATSGATTSAHEPSTYATQDRGSAAPLPIRTCAPRAQARATATRSRRVPVPAPGSRIRRRPSAYLLIADRGVGASSESTNTTPCAVAIIGCGIRTGALIAFLKVAKMSSH